ncbi:LacI family DNA-binding transcriptional regulator [Mesorhizobium sp. RP14(2022)]|uniref:LacI family DNA-binding transcriptional regulator n=2 Tax=Mesorhizobium liriopis TaxID=2953882 RepID=A0ABT1C0C6_9HYPH|nr:LacI family DNA-binding transcriptional regulator [Mesorhizobium liriopis]
MVSIALNSSTTAPVPVETLQRITTAAAELGYTPNRFAQALKTQRTMTIACIVPDITNPFYPALVRGVQKIAQDVRYDVITMNTDGDPAREHQFLDWAREGRVDGVIGVFFSLRATDLRVLMDVDIPVVRLESSAKHAGSIPIDDIYVDNRAAARAATEHLIARGHRHIAMVAGKGGPEAVRAQGYGQALAGIKTEPWIVLDEAFNEVGGHRAAMTLLDAPKRPTAIFAANDLMAIGVMQALRERKVAIPAEIAVIGFDDISAARLVSPSLSTVTQFQDRMGERAAEILLKRLKGDRAAPGTAEEMPFQLIEREST